VDGPNRQARRLKGTSDPLDAIQAAKSAWAAEAHLAPKAKSGEVEAIRALLVARRSARHMRVKTIVQMRHLSFTAPEQLRCRLKGLPIKGFVSTCARLRTSSDEPVTRATSTALRTLARRVRFFDDELASLKAQLEVLVHTAAALLSAAGDNPQRLRSEAAFARLCGAAPVPASSGKVVRHRLDRGGDRRANEALWRIVMVRLAHDPDTRAYTERRLKEGRSKREVIRSLKTLRRPRGVPPPRRGVSPRVGDWP
jgi:transposase